MRSVTHFRQRAAVLLKPAPGNHSGIAFTIRRRCYQISTEDPLGYTVTPPTEWKRIHEPCAWNGCKRELDEAFISEVNQGVVVAGFNSVAMRNLQDNSTGFAGLVRVTLSTITKRSIWERDLRPNMVEQLLRFLQNSQQETANLNFLVGIEAGNGGLSTKESMDILPVCTETV